jgi:uncharacterized membrane protein YfcA
VFDHIEWYHYLIAIVGGLLAGVINTLAGNGSTLTLTIFMEMLGMPADMANGTNRIGIFTQTSVGAWEFYRAGRLNLRESMPYVLPLLVGAMLGVEVSLMLDPAVLKSIIGYLMIFLLLAVLVKPERWLRDTDRSHKVPLYITIPVFFALGFYGGFIQMGMGLFFLAAMVLGARFSLVDANAIKLWGVTLFTAYVLLRFMLAGKINWWFGGIVALGQGYGGWLAARFATRIPNANVWIYRLLILIMLIAIAKVFGLI